MIGIRSEAAADEARVRRINELAFGQPLEATLVDRLRRSCPDALSLVAVDDDVIGHILFTPATIETGGAAIVGMGLGPLAVLPDRQRQGVGSRLVRDGLARLRAAACPFVVVIGHPDYYPRFGFERAAGRGLRCQWDGIPDDAFMINVLQPEALVGASGVVRYRPEFD